MKQQPMVREVMPPLKSPNITLAQAKRAWLTVMREEEERKKAEQNARAGEREAPGTEA